MPEVFLPPKWKSLPERFPKLTWQWCEVKDYGSPRQEGGGLLCDLCGTPIRYGHTIKHRHWPDKLIVGRTCASYAASVDAAALERKFRAQQARAAATGPGEPDYDCDPMRDFSGERAARAGYWDQAEETAEAVEQARLAAAQEATLTRDQRIESLRRAIWKQINESVTTFHEGWHRSTRGNLTRSFDCSDYFSAGGTIFATKEDDEFGFKYVLNMPRQKKPEFGRRLFETEQEALTPMYLAYRTYMLNLLRSVTPLTEWVAPKWQNYVSYGIVET